MHDVWVCCCCRCAGLRSSLLRPHQHVQLPLYLCLQPDWTTQSCVCKPWTQPLQQLCVLRSAVQVRTVAYCGRTSACSRHCAFAFSLIGPGSHMCANIGRNHRNNHVFYVLDFANGVYCQKCHDLDCWGFRSPWSPLPQDVWQRERLFGQQQQQQ